jgi:hypothetical protein
MTLQRKPTDGYMGARKGDPLDSFMEFKERTKKHGLSVRMVRARYKYYTHSWRQLNDVD